MKRTMFKRAALGAAVFFGMSMAIMADRPSWAPDDNDTLLQAGIAVHTFGASPDSNDDDAVLRLYDTHAKAYDSSRPEGDFTKTFAHTDWVLNKIGNVYGIAIDNKRNIYVAASANWASGYVGKGDGDGTVLIKYGLIGDPNSNDSNLSAGTVYKIDSKSGEPTVFTHLPQVSTSITNQVCEGTDNDILRQTGPGLGNIAYDKFHNQFFISNFSDGLIYRVGVDGTIIDSFDTGLLGLAADGKKVHAPYGLAVDLNGSRLYYGTMETNYHPQLWAVKLDKNGSFLGQKIDQKAKLVENIRYTQNVGGKKLDNDNGTWAAYSDLEFTPDGDLMIGVRVGCKGNFATSYNHGGVVYLLSKDTNSSLYNKPSSKTPGTGTNYTGDPKGESNPGSRAGWYTDNNQDDHYNYDAGAIPLHPHYTGHLDEEALKRGPDDGYGGVAVWQEGMNGSFDLYATSADIMTEEGVHGFMQFSGDFNITSKATIHKAIGFQSVASSTDDDSDQDHPHDYKGIGGDVEVLSVVPVSIGSYVWEDNKHKNGIQDPDEPGICGVTLKITDKDGHSVKDIDGNSVSTTTTSGVNCTYKFDNLPEGDYRVCVTHVPTSADHKFLYTKTPTQNGADNDDAPDDSNFANGDCSGLFTLVANSEPVSTETQPGDDQDDAHDTWGNMTVDFGYVKNVFDLALIKKLVGDEKRKAGDNVTFTITVTNQGNVDATNVEVSDYIPEGLILADAGWTESADGKTATKSIGALAAGASKDVNIIFTIDSDYQGTQIVNRAEITDSPNDLGLSDIDSTPDDKECSIEASGSGADNSFDAGADNGCDDIDPAKIIVEQHFDLAIKKQVDAPAGTKFKRGDNVTFIITVYNQGTVTAKNIQIRDIIPDKLTLDDSSWNQDGGDAVLKTPIPVLKPGKSTARKIVFKINNNASGKIVNIAEIKSATNDQNLVDDDSIPGNGVCTNDQDNDPDYKDGGCDDVDPAQLKVDTPHNVSPAVDTSGGGNDADPDCDCADGNTADAMSHFALLLMLLSTLAVAMRFLPRDEQIA